jgi:elongation of very long chain fatty acids protein 6
VFSIVGAIAVCPFFIQMLMEKGERYMYCTPGAETHLFGPSGFWICAFCLSKIPELMDTVFLVIRKRPVIFLHWWHHTTVMLFCWYGHMLGINVGPWFAAMNYFVHSIMYTYYFGMSAGGPFRAIVKPFAMTITILQLVQMVFGLYVTVRIQLILDYSEDGASCQAHRTLNLAGLGMYLSYFVLFGNFFYHNYIKAGGRKRAAAVAVKPKVE